MSADKVCPIMVGQKVPDVTLTTPAGEKVNLLKASNETPVMIIFYRGSWCPYCNTHLAELRKIESDIKGMGFKIIAISPDKPEFLTTTEEKQKISYTLLSDSKMEAAKAFGLAYKVDDETLKALDGYNIDLKKQAGESHEMLPVPAAILAKDGKIGFVFTAPDYTIRVNNKVLMSAAEVLIE